MWFQNPSKQHCAWQHTVIPELGSRHREIAGVHWTASWTIKSRILRDTVLKNKINNSWRITVEGYLWFLHSHVCLPTHVHVPLNKLAHTCTQNWSSMTILHIRKTQGTQRTEKSSKPKPYSQSVQVGAGGHTKPNCELKSHFSFIQKKIQFFEETSNIT